MRRTIFRCTSPPSVCRVSLPRDGVSRRGAPNFQAARPPRSTRVRWNGTSLFLITVQCRLCEREQYDRAGFVSLVLGKVGNAIDYITAASLTYPNKGDRELHHSIVTLLVAYLNKTEDKNSSLRGLMESHSPAPGIGASLLDSDGQQKLVSRGIPSLSLSFSLFLFLFLSL